MPPKSLYELLDLAYEAANHKPNWPNDLAAGKKKWIAQARQDLANALGKLGFVITRTRPIGSRYRNV
jgi:hypothetical protein